MLQQVGQARHVPVHSLVLLGKSIESELQAPPAVSASLKAMTLDSVIESNAGFLPGDACGTSRSVRSHQTNIEAIRSSPHSTASQEWDVLRAGEIYRNIP